MSAPIDIECPACNASAGQHCFMRFVGSTSIVGEDRPAPYRMIDSAYWHIDRLKVQDPASQTPISLDDLRQMITELAHAIRRKLGPRSAVIVAAGLPIDDNHDRFSSCVTGPCLMSRGLLAWSQRAIESQIDAADTSIDEDGKVK